MTIEVQTIYFKVQLRSLQLGIYLASLEIMKIEVRTMYIQVQSRSGQLRFG